MLTISLDCTAFDATLAAMQTQLAAFPQTMADELTNWQTEDMNRKYPNTTLQNNEATTTIWPTSRLPQKKRQAQLRKPPIRRPQPGPRIKSKRPILRPELFDKLDARMVALLEGRLAWQ
jgi:hypothetical protein